MEVPTLTSPFWRKDELKQVLKGFVQSEVEVVTGEEPDRFAFYSFRGSLSVRPPVWGVDVEWDFSTAQN